MNELILCRAWKNQLTLIAGGLSLGSPVAMHKTGWCWQLGQQIYVQDGAGWEGEGQFYGRGRGFVLCTHCTNWAVCIYVCCTSSSEQSHGLILSGVTCLILYITSALWIGLDRT